MATRLPIARATRLLLNSKLLGAQATSRISLPATTSQTRCISAFGYEQAKALTFSELGEPAKVLKLHSHSISPSHSDQLTIRFLASPINPADINQIQGVYPSKANFTTSLGTSSPIAVGGNEGVAEVISAGSSVKTVGKGDWVMMKAPSFGTWRTHAQTTEDKLLKIDDKTGLSPQQVGTVSVNPCTAYRMLQNSGVMKEGDWFIQNGANSGVGRAAIQLGKLFGYKSINVIRDRPGAEELKKELKDIGADLVITDSELQSREIRDKVKEITSGGREKIKLGLNCVGGKPAVAMAKLLSADAHFVTYGAMSKQPLELPASLLIFKEISFNGFWVSKWSEKHPEEKKKTVNHVLDLTRQGKFKDTPMDEIVWNYDTEEEPLVNAVKDTLSGYRKGKGIFLFGKT